MSLPTFQLCSTPQRLDLEAHQDQDNRVDLQGTWKAKLLPRFAARQDRDDRNVSGTWAWTSLGLG